MNQRDTNTNKSQQNILYFIVLTTLALLIGCITKSVTDNNSESKSKIKYPVARMSDTIDDFHGTPVPDPYDWMGDPKDAEVIAWVDAENLITREFIDSSPAKLKLKARYTELFNFSKFNVPTKAGGRYFYSKNDGLQNQAVIYVQETLDGEPKIVLDPNKLSEDGTAALSSEYYSPNGKYLAYGVSRSGSDWQEISIRNIDEGVDFEEVLKYSKFSGIAWNSNNDGFYYNRFPDPSTVEPGQESYNSKVYYHKLGTPQNDDKLIYERSDKPEYGFFPFRSDDGKYLLLWVWHGSASNNRIYYREMDSDGDFIKLFDEADAVYSPINNVGKLLYVQTNKEAPKSKIIAVDLNKPEPENWKTIVPEEADVIESAVLVGNKFVVSYMHDAHARLKIFDLEGNYLEILELPTIGSVKTMNANQFDTEMFFSFESFLFPKTIYRYDFSNESVEEFLKPEVNFDQEAYKSEQVFFESKDGTLIPMFLTYKKGLVLDGNNPTLMYAYGGFNINKTPVFSTSKIMWLENGGIYAYAVLRGGGEYGEEWHKAGMLEKKQNVFDDFIAAGRWLISNGYTNSSRLAIMGGSNGGLLVAAVMLQEPTLFGAVVCQVPVADMLRYQMWTVGRYWTGEYGNAVENRNHFNFLYKYSPLHNVKKGTVYPPIIVTTADTDDRVVPTHSKKFVATLQAAADEGGNPILIRIEKKAGHGAGKPTSKIIDEQSDIYGFLFKVFGME